MSETIPAELAQARGTIDNIDAALIHLLAERFKCTQRVGHIKADLGLPASDPGRSRPRMTWRPCAPSKTRSTSKCPSCTRWG